MGAAAGVGAGAEAGVAAGTAVDVEPESCTEGLGASEAGGEAVAAGLAFHQLQRKMLSDQRLHSDTLKSFRPTLDKRITY